MKIFVELLKNLKQSVRNAKSSLLTVAFVAIIGISFTSCLEEPESEWGAGPGTSTDNGSGGRLNLSERLQEIHATAESGGDYTIELTGSGNIGAQPLSFSGRINITIRLIGTERERTIFLTDNGSLFTIESGVTLILDNRVTLSGHSNNNAPLVRVNSGGMLIMKAGAKISGNTAANVGGVYVATGGSFLMEGGEVSGNTASGWSSTGGGGGMRVASGGDFLMEGGKISGNTARNTGGGIYVDGRFTMKGGEISGNTSSSGGGVFVERGNFTMEGGRIFGNTANTTSTSSGGGGVYVSNAIFTMSGGEIFFNIAPSGGGVFVTGSAGIIKEGGGTVFGYAMGDSNRNTATTGISGNNRGHAVFVNSSPNKRRETTAGPGLNLDSNISGAAGGWE
jgi:predicted outer membrane repeat protein